MVGLEVVLKSRRMFIFFLVLWFDGCCGEISYC